MRKAGFMTIGYGNMHISEFIEKLKALRVNCIVDVRTRPYSKYNMAFSKESLRDRLNEEGITYFWFGNKLGGKYDKIKYCNAQGIVDYIKVADSQQFKDGIKELESLIPSYNICVMCSEKEPLRCHRFLLISRALKNYNIYHIMADDKLVSNSDLEKRLLSMYGNAYQLSLFEDENAETIQERAYREHGLKTAYKSERVKEMIAQGIDCDLPEKIKVFCIGCEGKTPEQFFELLKEYKVKRIVDVRSHSDLFKTPFANYPDIMYYLKINCISYEKIHELVPLSNSLSFKDASEVAKYLNMYAKHIANNNAIKLLLDDELDGTCFLGYEESYKKCHRHIIIKQLKEQWSNITVRHLR